MTDTFFKGMDISSLLEVERCHGCFYDGNSRKDLFAILQKYGVNLIRLRLWNDPFDEEGNSYLGGGCDLDTVRKLALRAQSAHMEWMLDFHYSDAWADPGKQIKPKAWKEYGVDALEEALYGYTKETLLSLKTDHLIPAIVSVGNELTHGLLWPEGRTPHFDNIARFISSAIKAVREVLPESKVIIHLDNGGNMQLYRYWFEEYFMHGGSDFDMIGLSYYPVWHGTLPELKRNLAFLSEKYHKDLLIAETAYPFTLEDYQSQEGLEEEERKGMAARKENTTILPFEISESGQKDFLETLVALIREVPHGCGRGFVYWEPAWLPCKGSEWASKAAIEYLHEKGPGGNEWANQGLFDYEGNALEALKCLKEM